MHRLWRIVFPERLDLFLVWFREREREIEIKVLVNQFRKGKLAEIISRTEVIRFCLFFRLFVSLIYKIGGKKTKWERINLQESILIRTKDQEYEIRKRGGIIFRHG